MAELTVCGCSVGLTDEQDLCEVEIRETYRVHQHAAAAIARARKPSL